MRHYSYYHCGTILIMAAIVLTGCVPSKVREGADLLAAYTHQVSEEGTDFVRSRTAITQARRSNIAMIEVNTVELENAVSRDLAIWELSGNVGKRRVELTKGVRALSNSVTAKNAELSDLRKRHEASIAAAKSAVDMRQAELSKVSNALATLSQDLDFQSEVKFFTGYFDEVKAGIHEAKEQAKQQMKNAEASTKKPMPTGEGVEESK
jgi:chaperonin cofactor prefoldin